MGLLDNAQVDEIQVYEGQPTTATPTNYTANQITNTPTMDANKYTATTANADTFNANTKDETGRNGMVEDRLTGLLSKGSDYMRLAETTAKQQMAARGLSNSSLAVGAAHNAAINSAMPIAQQDAQTHTQVGMANTAAKNQFNMSNQQYQNQADRDNAIADNTASQFNAQTQQQTNLANQQATNDANRFEAQASNEFAARNMDAINQFTRDFTQASNTASMQNVENQMRILLAGLQDEMSNYATDMQRKTALDGIASTLIQSGVSNGVFATVEGGANWISMIGQLYPDMGLSISDSLSTQAAESV